jgi:hypothetical protein
MAFTSLDPNRQLYRLGSKCFQVHHLIPKHLLDLTPKWQKSCPTQISRPVPDPVIQGLAFLLLIP